MPPCQGVLLNLTQSHSLSLFAPNKKRRVTNKQIKYALNGCVDIRYALRTSHDDNGGFVTE